MDFSHFPDFLPDEPETPVSFFFEDVAFDLPDEQALREWLEATARTEGRPIRELNYVFCSDEHLRGINVEFLDHDYYTDVITFPNSDYGPDFSAGEVYISSERVDENAKTYGVSFYHELCRVMAHGLLHIIGYGDKTPEDEVVMRGKEDFYLAALEA